MDIYKKINQNQQSFKQVDNLLWKWPKLDFFDSNEKTLNSFLQIKHKAHNEIVTQSQYKSKRFKTRKYIINEQNLKSLVIADFCQHNHQFLIPIYPKRGTQGFVALEIFEQDSELAKYIVSCDIFSAGVILYDLLIGEPLLEKKGRKEQLELNRKFEIN